MYYLRFLPISLVFLALIAVFSVITKSLTGDRVLVILESTADRPQFSQFIGVLQERGFDVTVIDVNSNPKLFEFGERCTDHVFILTPTKPLKGNMSPKHLVSFMRDGGNLFLTLASNTTESHKDLVYELGIEVVNSTSNLKDFFHAKSDDPTLIASFHYTRESSMIPDNITNSPTLFRGVGLVPHEFNSIDTVLPVLSANPTTNVPNGPIKPIHLIMAVQALNGARAMVLGSTDMLTDDLFDAPVSINKPIMDKYDSIYPVSGNRALVKEMIMWTLQEKSVVHISRVTHHKFGDNKQLNMYHIKDDIIVNVTMKEWHNDQWIPYLLPPQSNIMFAAKMIDSYIRLPMKLVFTTATTSTYSLTTRLPDRYGVFTFTVDHIRKGLSPVHHEELVSIRPFRHDEYPRWLPVAIPYYVASVSQMIASLILIAIWITHKHVFDEVAVNISPSVPVSKTLSTSHQATPITSKASTKEAIQSPEYPSKGKVRKRK